MALDTIGFIYHPADWASAIISASQGDWESFWWCVGASVPVTGIGAIIGKWWKKADDAITILNKGHTGRFIPTTKAEKKQ